MILGGNGLIGSALSNKLSLDGCEVLSIDKHKSGSENSNITFITMDIFNHCTFNKLIYKYRPEKIINCVNVATIFSRKISLGYEELINFYLTLYKSLANLSASVHYIQIGTTGSGGLGINIPFTHGDKIESLPIINKAAFAGISTSMLLLLSRSFNKPITISEIKPGLAIFDSKINQQVFDSSNLILLNGGESGSYTYNELALLTSYMGFTTSEYIIKKVISVINGEQIDKTISSFDIIYNLNKTIIKSDQEDDRLKNNLLSSMQKAQGQKFIIATGNLGPPSITADLLLAYIAVNCEVDSEESFKQEIITNKSIKGTLNYIKHSNMKLFWELKEHLFYKNYLKVKKYQDNYSEPWELIHVKLSN